MTIQHKLKFLKNYSLLIQILILCFALLGNSSLSALPISEGEENSKAEVNSSRHKHSAYHWAAPNKASSKINVIAGLGLFLMPFLLFIPFAWTYVLGMSGLWLTALILIGIASLIQAILTIIGLGNVASAEGKLKLWGTSFAWFSLMGGSISLIWGLVAGVSFLWILGIPFFILAFALMILLVTHPNAK